MLNNQKAERRKAAVNRRKHGIDFADVTAVFEDDRALTVEDEITAGACVTRKEEVPA